MRTRRTSQMVRAVVLAVLPLGLLWPGLSFAQSPRNLGNNEVPGSVRCVSADGLTFEACGGAGSGGGTINDGVSSAIKATVFDFTNSNPLGVVLRDTNGDYVSVGGGTQYNQGTVGTDTDVLTMAGCVRADTAAIPTGVLDGDRVRCIVDSTGRLWTFAAQSGVWTVTQSGAWTVTANAGSGNFTVVQPTGTNLHIVCDSGCSGSAGFVDNAAFTFGTTTINPIGGVLDDTATNAATENSAAIARITAQKALHTNLRNNAGTEVGTAGAPLRTDTTGATTQPISAASLPLPAGAATSANQDGIIRDGAGDTVQANVITGRLSVDGSGVTQPVSGTVTVTDGAGALNVIVDSSALPTGASTLAEQQTQTTALQLIDNLPLAQGAATAGQNGVLTQGAVTTGAPTYTTGNSNPLSLNTAGGLRVDGSGVTQPISGTVTTTPPANASTNVAQINGVAPLMGNGITGTGSQRVTIASDNTAFGVNNTQQGTASQNVAQFGGNAVATGTGVGGAGIPRVTLSNDSSLAANQSVNVAQVGGTAVTVGADNSASSTAKTPTLPARANAANPSWTETNQVPLSVDLAGNLRVNSTGGGAADGTVFTAGSTTFSPIGGVFNESLPSVTSGSEYAARLTPFRALHDNLRDSAGQETGTVLNPLKVQVAGLGAINNSSALTDRTQATVVTLDRWGNLQSTSTIGDGSGRTAALRGAEGAQPQDVGMVVQPSIAPALQCPFVVAINQTAGTQLVTNQVGRLIHVCHFSIVSASAQNISLIEGTGAVCATAGTGLHGGTTASVAYAANGGIAMVSDRIILPMQKPGDNLCLLQSAAGNVSGTLVYGLY